MTTPGASTIDGRILAVSQTILGDELTAAAAVGATSLPVDDAIDFGEGSGTVRIGGVGGEVLAYSTAGDQVDGTGLVTLAGPTTLAHAAGDRVDLWDPANGVPFVTWRALVDPVSDLEVADPIDAVISHALIPLLPEGIRDPGEGEAVTATRAPSGWMLTDVRGKSPQIDGGTITPGTVPQAALSFTFGTGTVVTMAAAPPANPAVGDLWYDTANGNRMNTWTGSAWVIRAYGIAAIDPSAVGAKTSLGTTPPVAPNNGDLWLAVDANGGIQMQRWDGTAASWTPLTWNTDAIAANAISAGKIAAGALNAVSVTTSTLQGHVVASQITGSDFVLDSDNGRVLVYQQTATTQTLTGTGQYTVPAGVTSLKVEAWGGGGGGGGGAEQTGTYDDNFWGGGGGGGEYARENALPVTPGDSIGYTAGRGGNGGAPGSAGATSSHNGGAGNAGADTIFGPGPTSTTTVTAHAGRGGVGAAVTSTKGINGAGGVGGTGSTNAIHFDGGAGSASGGGGSSAGASANGNTAAYNTNGGTGATAPTGGGKGGNPAIAGLAAAGTVGTAPGGGGGGGNGSVSPYNSGLAGAAGKIVVTYYATTLVASIAAIPGTDVPTGTAYPAGMKVYRADLVETPAPIGSITMFAGPTAPAGYLLCQGQTVPRSGAGGYPALFSVIGTAYGAGDGSTTFTLPDLRVRLPLGAGSRPAGAAGSAVTVAVGATGGNDAHTHTFDDGGHTHTTPAHTHPLSGNGGARIMLASGGIAMDTAGVGSGFTTNWSATATGYARASGAGSVGNPASNAALMGATDNSAAGTSGTTHANGTTAVPSNGYPPYSAVNYIIKF